MFRGEGAFPLLMGIISGYPTGAKIVTNLRNEGVCTKEEAERLISFTNNSGPLFIIGTVGISMFADSRTGILLLITHILACISVGICFRFWKYTKSNKHANFIEHKSAKTTHACFSNLGEILANSIMNSVHTLVMIGGFVVLFSVIVSILKQSHVLDIVCFSLEPIFNKIGISLEFLPGLFTGIFELTNGVKEISLVTSKAISTNVILCSFLLGFGGISVLLQVFSITSKSDISIKPYFLGKLLQGVFAAFYTFLFLKHTTFFNLDLAPTFANITNTLNNGNNFGMVFSFVVIAVCMGLFWKFKK